MISALLATCRDEQAAEAPARMHADDATDLLPKHSRRRSRPEER
jgi:hypothetical protein